MNDRMSLFLLTFAVFSAVFDFGSTIGISDEEVSYQVSLHLSYNNEFLCGGVIVSPTEVVTVADKLYYSWGGVLPNIIIRIRTNRSSLNDDSFQEFEVENVFFHPNFDKKTMENNIAVLQTTQQFSFVGLGGDMTVEKILPNSICSITGWNEETMDLQSSDVNVVECGEVYSSYSGLLCARRIIDTDALCKMSVGSSLICDKRFVALLSITPHCNATDQIAVFESVTFANSSFETKETTSASTSDVIIKTFSLGNLLTAILSFVISVFFQYYIN